jgi:hypothetical protein
MARSKLTARKSKKQISIIVDQPLTAKMSNNILKQINKDKEEVIEFLFKELNLDEEQITSAKEKLTKKYSLFESEPNGEKKESPKKPSTKKKEGEEKKKAPEKEKEKKTPVKKDEDKNCTFMMTEGKHKTEPKRCAKSGTKEISGKLFCATHYEKGLKKSVQKDTDKEKAKEDSDKEDEPEVKKETPKTNKIIPRTTTIKVTPPDKNGYKYLKLSETESTKIVINSDSKAAGTVNSKGVFEKGVFSEDEKKMLAINNIEILNDENDLSDD